MREKEFSPEAPEEEKEKKEKKYKKYKCLKTLEGHRGAVYSVIESHDGKEIISGSWDNTIKIWDKETGECKKTLEAHEDYPSSYPFSIIESRDGKKIISGSYGWTIKIFGVEEE
ncbi:MAG: WD40 repeat domain-containing protein [Patescibacteria group bacterium]